MSRKAIYISNDKKIPCRILESNEKKSIIDVKGRKYQVSNRKIQEERSTDFNKDFVASLKDQYSHVRAKGDDEGEVKAINFFLEWIGSSNDPAVWLKISNPIKVKAVLDADRLASAIIKLDEAFSEFANEVGI
jgi:hypothetical protein